MAAVYLAYDLRLNRKVAIKVMLPELTYHEGMEERFKREARTAAKLDHPNIVVIHSVRDVGELLFFVMKFIDGTPLDALIRSHPPLPLDVSRSILFQLCNALQYAHDEGVVHRDVKPANVIIDTRGGVHVTDFGIAKATEAPNLTRTGTAIGTPAYMSPEQCLGQSQSASSDQYSVGVVAYELIAGRPPFSGAAVEIQWSHVREAPVPLTDVQPTCPPELAATVMRMIAKPPGERWPSLRDVIPRIASGVAEAEAARPALIELVRASMAAPKPPFAITPASPVPQRLDDAGNVVTAIVVSPDERRLEVGENLQLEARSSRDGALSGAPTGLTWTSSDTTVADVTPAGLVTGMAPGTASVTAKFGTFTANCSLSVESARVASLELTPRRRRLEVGSSERFSCVLRDARGATVDGTPTWSSSNPSIASTSEDGVVTAIALGEVTIAAMKDELAATASVEVVPEAVADVRLDPSTVTLEQRKSLRLHLHVANRRGAPIPDRPVSWTVGDSSIASVGSDGVVTGCATGATTVTATVEGRTATVRVVVIPATVACIRISPAEVSPIVGDAVAFTATAVDSLGVELDARPVKWRTSGVSVAQVNAEGTVTARREGVSTISAEIDGISASVTLTVKRAPLAHIEIGPEAPRIRVGKKVRLRPVGRDARGAVVMLSDNQWTSSDETIATVDSDGVVTAHREGTTAIGIASAGRTAQVVIAVEAAPPRQGRKWLVFAGAGAIALGTAGLMFVLARGRSSSGVAPSVRPTADAPLPRPATSTLPAAPNSVAVAPVPRESTASPTTSPTVTMPKLDTTVATIRVTPDTALDLEIGQSARLSVVALNRAGELLPRARAQWRSSNPDIATVSNSGEVRGARPGQTSIVVRSETGSKAVDVRVRDAMPTRLALTIRKDSLRVGETSSTIAQAYDRRGASINRAVAWRSSNPGVVTVDVEGTVRAIGPGRANLIATVGSIADSVRVVVVQPTPTVVTAEPKANPAPTASEPPAHARNNSAQNAAGSDARQVDTAPPAIAAKAPSEGDVRAIADTIVQLIERRQIARLLPSGSDDANKLRADLLRFLDRNHPSARVAGSPVVGAVRAGSARITVPVAMEWRTIGGRQNRSVTFTSSVEAIPGGWAIRDVTVPAGFNP
jgi:uncharacterized protein YjdB